MRGRIFDLLELGLLAFFVAVSGSHLIALLGAYGATMFSEIITLVATTLLFIVLLIQLYRRLKAK
jgi:hypothetical protein